MGRDTTAAGREGICAEQSESKVKSRAQEESDALIPASAVLATWGALRPPCQTHSWTSTHTVACELRLPVKTFPNLLKSQLVPSLRTLTLKSQLWDFPCGLVVKKPPANTGDASSITGCRRPPGEKTGNLLQYSFPGNPVDRAAWYATVPVVAKTQLSD